MQENQGALGLGLLHRAGGVGRTEPAPQHQLGTSRDRLGDVVLHHGQVPHGVQEVGRPRQREQLGPDRDPARLGAGELVDGHEQEGRPHRSPMDAPKWIGSDMTNLNTSPQSSSTMQKAAMAVAAVFALVGILGFVPGITTNYDQMEFAGHESGAQLLGIFGVSILHNLVHLLFGVVGFLLARTWDGARKFLVGGGVVYLVLALYGALVDQRGAANFVPVDDADNLLHLVLGLGMVALGVVLGKSRDARTTH